MSLTMIQARMNIKATQEEIAERMGLSVQAYARIEAQPEDITIKEAKLFCEIVGLSVSDIYFGY